MYVIVIASLLSLGVSLRYSAFHPRIFKSLHASVEDTISEEALVGLVEADMTPVYSSTAAAERLFSVAAGSDAAAGDTVEGLKLGGRALLREGRRMNPRDEAWRYTNLRTLLEPAYVISTDVHTVPDLADLAALVEPGCEDSYVVVVDGRPRLDLSRISATQPFLVIRSLSSMAPTDPLYATVMKELTHTPESGSLPRDSFASDTLVALTCAAAPDALIIQCTAPCPAPLHVLQLHTASTVQPRLLSSLQLLIAAPNSSLSIKQSVLSIIDGSSSSTPEASLILGLTRVVLAPNSSVSHFISQDVSQSARPLQLLTSSVGEAASYDVTALSMGGRSARTNAHILLESPGANCSLNAVTLSHGRQSSALYSSIDHLAASTSSKQLQRNVVGDGGEAIFKGRIRIPSASQKSESDQQCRTLMLGDKARVVAMPCLEIGADDVVCSHGAAVCDLDENAMFYLSSRGINRAEARKLLLRSFVLELLVSPMMGRASVNRVVEKVESMAPKNDDWGGSVGSRGAMESI